MSKYKTCPCWYAHDKQSYDRSWTPALLTDLTFNCYFPFGSDNNRQTGLEASQNTSQGFVDTFHMLQQSAK